MALATGDDRLGGCDLHMELLPLVDLRLLSGPELLSLSLCSASNPSTSALDTDVLTPKIDRSVFNESAGSRKQTFSRLRLAPPRSNFHFSSPPKALYVSSLMVPEPAAEDNAEVVPLLKALFNISSESCPNIYLDPANLVSVHVEYEDNVPPLQLGTGFQTVGVDVVDYSEKKRKRGRPPKNNGENWAIQRNIVLYENHDGMFDINEKSGDLGKSDGVKRKRGRPRKNESQSRVIKREDSGIKSEGDMKNGVLPDNVEGEMVAVNGKCGMLDLVALEKDDTGTSVSQNEVIVAQRNPDGMLDVSEKFGDFSATGEIKRKRGRPRKNDSESRVIKQQRIIKHEGESKKHVLCDSVKGDMVAVNDEGGKMDLVALGNMEDPFGEELRRRTEGMRTEGELLEFMKSLEGDWVSQRKKRKIVDADYFGHILPNGWKLMLFVKKNAGRKWLACRRYISPNGQQFVSCKEVSSYLLSFIRLQDASQPNSVTTTNGISLADNQPSEELPVTSLEHQDQPVVLDTGHSGNLNGHGRIKCHKCTMNFDLEDEFISHLLSSHHGTDKGLDHDEITMKDGKYECQFCHKLFLERHEHDSHLELHIGNHENEVQEAIGMTIIEPQLEKVDTQVLDVQGSIRVLRDSSLTDSRTVNDRMGSSLPSSEVESYGSMHDHGCSSQDEQFLKPSRNIATFTGENHKRKDRVCITVSNKVEKIHQQENKAEKVDLCSDTSLPEVKAHINAEMTLANAVCHLEDLQTDSKEQSSLEDVSVISCDNERRFYITDHSKGVVSSITLNYVQATVSENCLASSADENIRVVNSNLNCFSASSLGDPELRLLGKSANNESTIDFLGGQEQKTLQGRESEGRSLALHRSGHSNDNSCTISDATRDKFLSGQVGDPTGSVHFISSSSTGYCDNVFDYFEPEKVQASQFAISSEKGAISSTLEELNQDKTSISNIDCGESSGIVNKSKENMYSVGGLCFSSSTEQTYFGKNMNALPTRTALEESNFEAFENSRRIGVTMGFPDLVQNSGDAISQLVWKKGQDNYMLAGLNDTSSPLFQSSSSYPKFDRVTYKGERDFFSFIGGSCSDISNVEGMRPGGIERMEYNFFSDPTSTHLENSKVTSYDSAWMEKERFNLLPKIAGRNQNTVLCSWCGNAFHDEAINISPQGVSALHMCPGCSDRFSRNDHFL